jgi:hypothetical protein
MKNTLHRLIIAASLAAIVQTASAEIFVSDGFMVSSNTQDVNQELLTSGRQTGTLYPATYDGWQNHHQVGNNGTDVGQPGGPTYKDYVLVAFNGSFFSDLDIASLASGPLTNEFDMYQKQDGSTEWGACSLRSAGTSYPIAGAGEFGFLQRRNGGVQVFQNGNVPGAGTWDRSGFASSPHWKLIFSDTNGTGSAFNGNGSQVTLINGTTTLGTLTLGQLKSNNLRLGFNASGGGLCGIDNLTIYGTPAAPRSPNLSFEYDAVASGNIAAFSTWHRFVDPNLQGLVGGVGGDFGSEFPGTAEYSVRSPMAVPADGNQFLFLNMNGDAQHLGVLGGVYQDMGPMIPNHTYTLTVAIGSRKDRINSPGVIELVNGTNNLGTVLATGGGLPDTQDTWQDYTVTYTTGPTVSGDLTICLGVVGASTVQANFDNVRLDSVSPILNQNIVPSHAETFVGDQIIFTVAYSNDPPVNLQWQQITTVPVATNNINTGVVIVTNNGIVTSTLTLNNVQLTDAGSYRLEGLNAAIAAPPSYSAAAPLAVSTPTTVGNVIQKNSAQAGPPSFYPAWTMNTNADLIFGFSVGAGNAIPSAAGSYALDASLSFDASVLSDGNVNSANPNMCSCGWAQLNPAPGESMTYTLPTTTYGYAITNITVYGGWSDDGRNEQKYQVLYSTVSAPLTYVSIGTFDYNPALNDSGQNANRVILIPASGVLAQNVASVQLNFNMQSKNNWNGYSEITIGGTPALGLIPALTQDIAPLTAEDVVGSKLTLTGAFSGATSYQWQKNGTNLIGQTLPTLTLSNLQRTDTATNGGYRLLGINVAGTNSTRGCTVVVDPAPVATNNVIIAVAYQTSDAGTANPFSSTWDTSLLGASLIAGQNPPTLGYGTGNFNDPDVGHPYTAGGLPVLTDGSYGIFAYDGSHPAFATCGTPTSSAGQYVAYLLGDNANGYNVTNIQIAGGWNDDGRDSQFYTILYSTVSNPNIFLPLTSVANNLETPRYGVSDSTVVRTTFTPATGMLASNVYALEIDFQYPQGVPHGYSGYSEISVFGSPSATPPPAGPVITTEHEETGNIWTVETPNLIAGLLPSSQGPGVFTGEGCNVTNLTDGILGFGAAYGAACGADTSASVSWIAFTPTNGSWNLTNIVVYTLWTDYGRDGQFYNVSYSTQSAPATFLPLASVAYNPFVPTGVPSGNRVAIAPPVGQSLLASNVAALKFDFTSQGAQDFGWSGYTEIVLQGTNVPSAIVIPPTLGAPKVSGGNLILTGTGGTPNHAYTWLSTTNLSAPIIWTTNTTGVLGATGSFSNAIPVNVSQPADYFRLRMP